MTLLQHPAVNAAARALARPFAARVPERWQFPVAGEITVRPDGGAPFRLAANPTSYLAKVVFWGGAARFEPELAAVFRDLARTSRLFLDVGANIGYYGLLARAYQPAIRVVAFEPVPDIAAALARNRDLNGADGFVVERLALGATSGPVAFHAPRNPKYPGLPQLGGTGSVNAAQAAMHGASDPVTATGETLDAYAARALDAPADLVKIDVEGAELDVLRGGAATLAAHRPVVLFEALASPPADGGPFAFLRGLGFDLYAATPAGLVPLAADARPAGVTNFVAAPPETAARLAPSLRR